METQHRIDRLRGRFQELARRGGDDLSGAHELAAGLAKMTTDLAVRDVDDPERFEAVVQGLSKLADFLEENCESAAGDEVGAGAPSDDDATEGLDQFVATFRKDAGNRIQGLSISLMGIFGDECNDEALAQSVDHLHAIRGSAAMLGFEDIAELAAEMENLLATRAKLEVEDWEWPTKSILRGYALLEMAIDADPPGLKPGEGEGLVEQLRSATAELKAIGDGAEPDRVSRETPVVDDAADSAEESAPAAESKTDRQLEQPILVVDDVETIAASVGFILSELEVPIEVASDGKEAIQMLNQKSFSVVISDIDMPRMDGITLTEMIRADDRLCELPVILLTSLDSTEQRERGKQAGATDYIIKGSIGGGELLRRVRELLDEAPVVQRREPQRKRHILVAEDTETVAASIAFVLSEGPFEIMLATDGKDAMRRLQEERFDLLITDLQMPYMNGIELVETLRSRSGLDELPVVMLTSVEDEQERAAAMDAGVDRYMIKGEIAGGRLLSEVESLLDER